MMQRQFSSFSDFYPFYLSEHSDLVCRRLHFAGSTLVVVCVVVGVLTGHPWWFVVAPFVGYGFAWIGHFFFERNRPATFSHPLYSLLGDWVMFKDMLTGKMRF